MFHYCDKMSFHSSVVELILIPKPTYVFLKETVVSRMSNVLDDFIELYVGAISQLDLCGTVISLRLASVYW